ncbi:MAG: 2-dehydropantoate 2-reductase N-terminal domain-containing protein, partial [Limisphaerales bacterium]
YRAGFNVNFLVRSDYEAVRRNGIYIKSVDGDFHITPQCATDPSLLGTADLVIIGLKTTANYRYKELISPLVNSETLILTLQNGLGNEDLLAKIFGEQRILGGHCFVCLNRIAPGIINHIAHGRVVIGEYNRKPVDRTYRIASFFHKAGIQCDVVENLEKAHWEKLVWNIPFNGLGVAGVAGIEAALTGQIPKNAKLGKTLTTDVLIADKNWEKLLRELMREVITVANAKGLGINPEFEDEQVERTRLMGAYKASTLLDFELNRPLELESMFLEPLRQAEQIGINTPRLRALCNVLVALDKYREKNFKK